MTSAATDAELLIGVWREVSRHLDLDRSMTTIAKQLANRLPVRSMSVLAFEREGDAVVLRTTEVPPGGHCETVLRAIERAQHRKLREWARDGRILSAADSGEKHSVTGALAALCGGLAGNWLAGALGTQREPSGVLLLSARRAQQFDAGHERFLEALLEPLSAALDNDLRLQELKILREAAEADKRAALQRLGRTELDDVIIGADAGLAPVLERVGLIAKSNMPVLILGETGTGKEIIARTIHHRSPRAAGPFIRVNCGAIPPDLIDSELFGHEKGAFTGALAMRRGWFERADRGTLLLDEIGELSAGAQVRLLRVLQEGTFERVGGETPIACDVRIVSATHRDLPAMIQNGRFREDLWYRIAAFPIILPPLRERRADIPALAEHFAERAGRHFGLRIQRPTAADLMRLVSYDWPGNIREFAAVIDRAVILGEGERLEIERALGGMPAAPRPSLTGEPVRMPARAPAPSLNDAMRETIQQALEQSRGRIEGPHGAAAALEINPHTLRARMRKLGIDWSRFRSTG
jgi:transcriptional regulator with GAF, ATPase, and Fis domain